MCRNPGTTLAAGIGLTAWIVATPAFGLTWSFLKIDSFPAVSTIRNCSMTITGSGNLATVPTWVDSTLPVLRDAGLGVEDRTIDGSESVAVDFDVPALGVRFQIEDGFGAYLVEAFDPGMNSLGVVPRSALPGVVQLEQIYGTTPLARFEITANGGFLELANVGYDTPASFEIDLTQTGNVNSRITSEVEFCDVGFSGLSTKVRTFHTPTAGGMGVDGGFNDFLLDGSETMQIDFGAPTSDVVLHSGLLDTDADGTAGRAVLQGFDSGGTGLTLIAIGEPSNPPNVVLQALDVNGLYGDIPLTRILLFASGDARRLDRVVVPEPGAAVGALGAVTAVLVLAWHGSPRRQRRP